jgi:hypothetical protein
VGTNRNGLNNSLDVRSKFLHDIYDIFSSSLERIIFEYTKNNWIRRKKYKLLLNNSFALGTDKTKDEYTNIEENLKIENNNNILTTLNVIIILGFDNIISVLFKAIIELVIKSEEHMKVNRTDLLFEIAEKIIKFTISRIVYFKNKDNLDKFIEDNNNFNPKFIQRIEGFLELIDLDNLLLYISHCSRTQNEINLN